MQAVLSFPATETAAALLLDRWWIALSLAGEPFYLGPFDSEREMQRAERLLIEPPKGTG